jgi:hypothetical protein
MLFAGGSDDPQGCWNRRKTARHGRAGCSYWFRSWYRQCRSRVSIAAAEIVKKGSEMSEHVADKVGNKLANAALILSVGVALSGIIWAVRWW